MAERLPEVVMINCDRTGKKNSHHSYNFRGVGNTYAEKNVQTIYNSS